MLGGVPSEGPAAANHSARGAVYTDHWGPTQGGKYILVIIDGLTQYTKKTHTVSQRYSPDTEYRDSDQIIELYLMEETVTYSNSTSNNWG